LSCEIYVKSVTTLFSGHCSIQVSAFRRLASVPIVFITIACASQGVDGLPPEWRLTHSIVHFLQEVVS